MIVALAMLANGCASVCVVDPDAPDKILRKLNASAEGKPVRVALLGGQKFSGTGIHAASDSTTWFEAGDRLVAVSTAEIVKVDVISRRRKSKVWQGALLGAIPGALLIGSAMSSEEQGDVDLTGLFGVVARVGGVLGGATLGFILGGEEQTTTTYILNARGAGFHLEDTP